MFSIGDFARLGLVSVRMLRHYDALGLLRPAQVDPVTGYRAYQAAQLSRLNRIVAIKDLGFTLEQVGAILDDKVSTEELHGMVRLRRAQLEARISADLARLRRVEARLRTIEREGHMRTDEVVLKPVAAMRIAELSGVAASYDGEDVGPVIKPLYAELVKRLRAADIKMTGPGCAYYLAQDDGTVMIHASIKVGVSEGADVDFLTLPGIETAATMIHHGAMENVGPTMQALAHWIEDNGYRTVGLAREVSLHCPANHDEWVTELQIEVAR